MRDWLFMNVTVHDYARWYIKVLGILLAFAQLYVLLFLATLVVKFAWSL